MSDLNTILNDTYGDMFDLISSENILLLFVSGFATENIAEYLKLTCDDVCECVVKYLDPHTIPLNTPLNCNPWYMYKKAKGNREEFDHLTKDLICGIIWVDQYYTCCQRFEKLRKEIEEFYEGN